MYVISKPKDQTVQPHNVPKVVDSSMSRTLWMITTHGGVGLGGSEGQKMNAADSQLTFKSFE